MKRNTTISRSVLARNVVVSRLRKPASGLAHKLTLLCLAMLLAWSGSALAQTNSMIVADFNHDGIPDVLAPSQTKNNFVISFGAVPYGTFASNAVLVPYPTGCISLIPGSVVVGDFNNDGIPDIALACASTTISIYVMLGNGDGTFTAAPTPLVGLGNVAVGDFNHDGKLDIVTQGTNASSAQVILFYAGNGDGTFAAAVSTSTPGAFYSSVKAVDINNDGFPDLVFGNFATMSGLTVVVYGNNQNGTFGTQSPAAGNLPNVSAAVGSYPASADSTILTGNFFGSGLTDLAVVDTGTNAGIFVLQNTSLGTTYSFAAATKTLSTGLSGAAAASFVSSYTDLLVWNGTTLSVLANNGAGSFSASYANLSVANTSSLFAAADANGDGHADIYTATTTSTGVSLAVNLVSGSATATSAPFSLPAGTIPITATWPGNINFSGSTANGTQIVNALASTTVLTSSANPSSLGQSVTFTATVSASVGVSNIPSGTVTFMNGTTTLGTGNLTAGVATFATATLPAGTNSITAVYGGDSIFATSTGTLSQVVSPNPTLTSFTPNTATIGAPNTTITITGTGFASTTVAQINGAAIATTLVNATTLTAVVPTADFATIGTLLVTLKNPATGFVTSSLPLTVSAPPVTATYNGPTSATPGSQPTLNLVIPSYPVALTATLTLNTTATLTSGVTDPNTLFSNGTTTFTFTIPAGTTTIPTIQLQAGTVEETITVPLVLTVNGVNVTPTGLAPVVIHVLPAVPTATSATLTRSGNVLTVTIDGYSNTREIVQANFTFTAVPGANLSTTSFTAPVGTVFATYYGSTASVPYGSTFVYTQTFNVDGSANAVASVQVTLTNTQGVSTTVTAQ